MLCELQSASYTPQPRGLNICSKSCEKGLLGDVVSKPVSLYAAKFKEERPHREGQHTRLACSADKKVLRSFQIFYLRLCVLSVAYL